MRGREKEKEEIDDEDDERGQTDEIRRWGIEIRVSRHVFIRREAVTGFYVFIYLSFLFLFLSLFLRTHGAVTHRPGAHIHTRDLWRGEPAVGTRRSQFSPLTPSSRPLCSPLPPRFAPSRSAAASFFPRQKIRDNRSSGRNVVGCRREIHKKLPNYVPRATLCARMSVS